MRKIIFRGKNDEGKWVKGFMCHLDSFNIGIRLSDQEFSEVEYVDSLTVGQFTGMTDISGQKIYEGDIVNGWHEDGSCVKNAVVKWDEMECAFGVGGNFAFLLNFFNEYEIVGNIYNKETKK